MQPTVVTNPKVKSSAKGVANDTRPPPAKGSETWAAYSTAYFGRYGVEPVRNRTTNAQIAAFVDRVGSAEAPGVAAHFVRSQKRLYLSAKHPTNLLLRDAEALRTEWATNSHGTEAEATMADQTQGRGNVFGKLIKEIEHRDDEK